MAEEDGGVLDSGNHRAWHPCAKEKDLAALTAQVMVIARDQEEEKEERKEMSEQLDEVSFDVKSTRRQIRLLFKKMEDWEKAWSWKSVSGNIISFLQIVSTALAIWAAWSATHVVK